MTSYLSLSVRKLFRDRFFSGINIAGLSIGLTVSLLLLLFVTNELSFDRHFTNHRRIVSLNTVWHQSTGVAHYPENLRRAYTELPDKVAGVEACTQITRGETVEVVNAPNYFQGLEMRYVDPEFFKVFPLTFIEGTPQTALANPNTLVITRRCADLIFGNVNAAVGKTISIRDVSYTVDAVVEPFPKNTHFSFDVLGGIASMPFLPHLTGLNFFTFYLIDPEASVKDVCHSIEQAYTGILSDEFVKWVQEDCYGETEMLADLYLFSKADYGLGRRSSSRFVWLLGGLSLLILLLAVTNFMHLFLAQGEARMGEIGIRKANGAGSGDLVKQFFSEVSLITLVAFMFGFVLAVLVMPLFSRLIERDVALAQVGSPWFILGALVVFLLTILLSAGYPSFYLSRFNPLNVLTRRVIFSRRRLTTAVVMFQSAAAIVLISYILVITRQTAYMKNLPIGYNPRNVLMVPAYDPPGQPYESLRQELLRCPEVAAVNAAEHRVGEKGSGQRISTPEDAENRQMINEYRVMPGLCELMEVQLSEGRFFNENDPNNASSVVLNEAAVKMLDLHPPYIGREVIYKQRRSTIIGVTPDFCYDEPGFKVMPLVFSYTPRSTFMYVRFSDDVSRSAAVEVVTKVFRKFHPDFVLHPQWSEDLIFGQKFHAIRTHSRIIFLSSLLSVIVATLGLVAIQSFATVRRTREIGLRRVNGATRASIVLLLLFGLIRRILAAGVIAIPTAYWLSSRWIDHYADKACLTWIVFAVPVLAPCLIAALVTWGVSLRVLSRNPVEALRTE